MRPTNLIASLYLIDPLDLSPISIDRMVMSALVIASNNLFGINKLYFGIWHSHFLSSLLLIDSGSMPYEYPILYN